LQKELLMQTTLQNANKLAKITKQNLIYKEEKHELQKYTACVAKINNAAQNGDFEVNCEVLSSKYKDLLIKEGYRTFTIQKNFENNELGDSVQLVRWKRFFSNF
jgi:hypothetical protein